MHKNVFIILENFKISIKQMMAFKNKIFNDVRCSLKCDLVFIIYYKSSLHQYKIEIH